MTIKRTELPPMQIAAFTIRVVGDSPLICHAWSEKAKLMILQKQMHTPTDAKEAKDPDRDFQESLYHLPGGAGYGFPAVAFKSAAVDACSHVGNLTKVVARGAFHIVGDMVQIEGTPTPRTDMVRIGMGTADIRIRGEFREWAAVLTIRHNTSILSAAQIVHLFEVAGFAVGVGEWRPQKEGSFGMFHVAREGEV